MPPKPSHTRAKTNRPSRIVAAQQTFNDDDQATGNLSLRTAAAALDGSARGFDNGYLRPGMRLDWLLVERRCLGFLNEDGVRIACANNAVATSKLSGYCEDCARLTRVPYALRKSHPTRPYLRPKQTPHVVYLACFDAHTVKVGTTDANRLHKRLAEQGARAALILARTEDEKSALRIEASIASLKRLDPTGKRVSIIPDELAPSVKLHALGNPLDADTAREFLTRVVEQEICERRKELEIAPARDLEFLSFEQPVSLPMPQKKRRLTAGDALCAHVVTTIGGFLILEENGQRFAVTIRSLLGWQYTTTTKKEEPRQLALFEG